MTLYLSRVALNPYSPAAMRLVGDLEAIHQILLRAVPCGPKDKAQVEDQPRTADLLFRVDPSEKGPTLLIQSAVQPDWTTLKPEGARPGLKARDLRDEPATKPFSLDVKPGATLGFRLLTRPVKRVSTGKGNDAGPRRDLRTDEERLAWLHRKAEASGFRVVACGLTTMTFAAVHSERPLRAKGGSFTAVRFDGELVVTDPDKFRKAVSQGIGTQKAFGFGLLSLGRV